MDLSVIAFQFQAGAYVLDRNLAGISHEQSLRLPDPAGNSVNWVVGHIVRTRNRALSLIQPTPLYDDADFAAYGKGGPGLAGALPLEDLRRRFDELGQALAAALPLCSQEQLGAPAPFSPTGNPKETVATLLMSIAFHEAYHLGQTGILRRLMGKPGAISGPDDRESPS